MSKEIQDFIKATHRHPGWPRIYCLGDSWFQYPLKARDLQKQLETLLRKEAILFNNSVPGRESAAIKRLLPQVRAQLGEWEFDLLLLSMGGNDVVGDELAEFVKPASEAQSPATAWPRPVPGIVDRHIRLKAFGKALEFVIDDIERVLDLRDAVAPGCQVLVNSYDYPIPSGKGFTFLGIRKGPWLKPFFEAPEVGLTDPAQQRAVARWLIDEFVAELDMLAGRRDGLTVVDARGLLPDPADWDNEIHPDSAGFKRIAVERWLGAVRTALGTA